MAKLTPKNKKQKSVHIDDKSTATETKKKGKSNDSSVSRSSDENASDDDDDDDSEEDDYSNVDFDDLIKQIDTEYEQAWWFIKPKWDEWSRRLKLYNNQKRDKDAVGDNTLFSIFQTVLASLYDDKLISTFDPREAGDDEVAENLTITAKFDHDEMEKDILDYEWDWEALFFGRSLMAMMEFDEDQVLPVPELWNVMSVLRDPSATSVNGDLKGRGRARFLGREVRLTQNEMDDMDVYFNYKDLKPDGTSTKSLIDENMRAIAEAQGLSDMNKFQNLSGENKTHRLLEWFTIYKGKRVFVTLADDRKKVVRFHELASMDIPLVDRSIYPIPNSWDGVSVPDLIEDKQRARAVAMNLALKSVKSSLHPMYLYDENKITDRNQLNFEFNKFIPVQGAPSGAVQVMERDQVKQDVSWILDTLARGGEQSTASPDIQQGLRPDTPGTATRDALINQKVDTRYSLSARIFGWSEKRFWRMWYGIYKEHLVDEIQEKSVRISGSLGAQFRPFTRKNLIGNSDPDVKVESKAISDARKFNELQNLRAFVQFVAADPEANIRFATKYMGQLSNIKKDVLERILPPTVEEMKAEEENILLRENPEQPIEVLPTDDHRAHLEIHNKMEDTPAKIAHINAHKRAMLLIKTRPELFPELQQQQGNQVNTDQIRPAGASEANRPVAEGSGRALPVQQ